MVSFCSSDDYKYAHEITMNNKLIASKLKFFPPHPSYKLVKNSNNNNNNSSEIQKVEYEILNSVPYKKHNIPDRINVSLYSILIDKKKLNKIIYMIIENNYQKNLNKEKTNNSNIKAILYSHENGTDLFRILPFLIDLSIQAKCDVISYDYFGFGCSTGKPNEKNFLNIYETIIKAALKNFNYLIDNILLMGKDIGAIPSIIIASRKNYNNCKGLILLSPIISEKIDINAMKSIICPTLLIQPKSINDKENEDDKIALFCREINNEKEWFPKDKIIYDNRSLFYKADILLKDRKKFISYIREYMKSDNNEEKNNKNSEASTNNGTSSEDNKADYIEVNDNKNDVMNSNITIIKNNLKESEYDIDYNNNEDY